MYMIILYLLIIIVVVVVAAVDLALIIIITINYLLKLDFMCHLLLQLLELGVQGFHKN